MPPPDRTARRQASLDAIRGLAVLLVIAFHFNVPGAHAAGRMGVTLFLVLSAYLIVRQLLDEQRAGSIDVVAFYQRRARRLVPALGVFLGVMLTASVLSDQLSAGPAALLTVIGLANYAPTFGVELGPLSHMWTLSLELQFYLAVPFLLTVAGRGTSLRLLVLAGAVGAAVWNPTTLALTVGGILALIAPSGLRVQRAGVGLIGALAMGISALVDNQSGNYHLIPQIIGASGAALLVAAAIQSQRAPRPLALIGRTAYSLYLWHLPIGAFVFWFAGLTGYPWWMAAVAACSVSFTVSYVSYRMLELPGMRLAISGRFRSPFLRRQIALPAVATRHSAVGVGGRGD